MAIVRLREVDAQSHTLAQDAQSSSVTLYTFLKSCPSNSDRLVAFRDFKKSLQCHKEHPTTLLSVRNRSMLAACEDIVLQRFLNSSFDNIATGRRHFERSPSIAAEKDMWRHFLVHKAPPTSFDALARRQGDAEDRRANDGLKSAAAAAVQHRIHRMLHDDDDASDTAAQVPLTRAHTEPMGSFNASPSPPPTTDGNTPTYRVSQIPASFGVVQQSAELPHITAMVHHREQQQDEWRRRSEEAATAAASTMPLVCVSSNPTQPKPNASLSRAEHATPPKRRADVHPYLTRVMAELREAYELHAAVSDVPMDAEHEAKAAHVDRRIADLRTRVTSRLETCNASRGSTSHQAKVMAFLSLLKRRIDNAATFHSVQRHEQDTLDVAAAALRVENAALTRMLRAVLSVMMRAEVSLEANSVPNHGAAKEQHDAAVDLLDTIRDILDEASEESPDAKYDES